MGDTTWAQLYGQPATRLYARPGETVAMLKERLRMTKEYTNDAPGDAAKGSIKYDAGKAPIFRGGLAYFPRAIAAVSEVSNFGASKYAWKGWENVPDGINRYSDAMVRHLAYEGKGEVLDPDSGLLHAAHCAWNSLARLELMLKEDEKKQDAVHPSV